MRGLSLKQVVLTVSISMFLVACLAVGGYAAQSAGDNEIQLSGGFFKTQGADVGTATVDVAYGYYLTNVWEIGIAQTLNYNIIDDADDTWTASTIPFVNYHFRGLSLNDTFQPFVGAFIGAIYNDDDTTGTAGPTVGFKAFLNDKTFLVTKYRYEWFFDDVSFSDVKDTSHGNHVVTVGLGFLW
jgi:hypothetical protein